MAKLHVAIDLGSDTLKIAFAHKGGGRFGGKGDVKVGKFAGDNLPTQIGIPAVAFLSKETGKWLYGNEVEYSGEQDFTTVVHIKALMTLLAKTGNAEIDKSNEDYYYNKTVFPKFYLPADRKHFSDLRTAEAENHTFDGKITPHDVCDGFFKYVKEVVEEGTKALTSKTSLTFDDIAYSIIYPPKVGEEYIKEFTRLVNTTFNTKVYKSLSSVKSLGIFANYSNLIPPNSTFLVFDIGEEYISVAKGWFKGDALYMDGQDGHKTPEEFGGTNVDEAIISYIESSINSRETFATPSYGAAGHVSESCLESKKYQLLKDIKSAKYILSSSIGDDELYASGVPLLICRDCYIQRYLTKDELKRCVGITTGIAHSAAVEIATYILEELIDPINDDVTQVIIAGGVIETNGLGQFIKSCISTNRKHVTVYTFDDEQASVGDDEFKINANESSVYAAVIGGAIVAANNIEIKMALSLSYGTWAYVNNGMPETLARHKTFSMFAEKGAELNQNSSTEFVTPGGYNYTIPAYGSQTDYEGIKDDEIFSTVLSAQEIRAGRGQGKHVQTSAGPATVGYVTSRSGERSLVVSDPGQPYRLAAETAFNLRTLISSHIWFYHNGKRVRLRKTTYDTNNGIDRKILFDEGISVDPKGVASVLLRIKPADFTVVINYWDNRTGGWSTYSGDMKTVHIREISMDYAWNRKIVVESSKD